MERLLLYQTKAHASRHACRREKESKEDNELGDCPIRVEGSGSHLELVNVDQVVN